jgi:hypothetical protein
MQNCSDKLRNQTAIINSDRDRVSSHIQEAKINAQADNVGVFPSRKLSQKWKLIRNYPPDLWEDDRNKSSIALATPASANTSYISCNVSPIGLWKRLYDAPDRETYLSLMGVEEEARAT